MRRILEARTYRDRVRAWAEREVRRSVQDEERLMYLFGRQLENWTRHQLSATERGRKSINLPAGTVGFRKLAPKLMIDNLAAVLAWARENLPTAIVTREHIRKSAVDQHMGQTGEVPIAGVRVEPGHDAFFIR